MFVIVYIDLLKKSLRLQDWADSGVILSPDMSLPTPHLLIGYFLYLYPNIRFYHNNGQYFFKLYTQKMGT